MKKLTEEKNRLKILRLQWVFKWKHTGMHHANPDLYPDGGRLCVQFSSNPEWSTS